MNYEYYINNFNKNILNTKYQQIFEILIFIFFKNNYSLKKINSKHIFNFDYEKYLNLTNYIKYIVTKHSNPQNCGHPPSMII